MERYQLQPGDPSHAALTPAPSPRISITAVVAGPAHNIFMNAAWGRLVLGVLIRFLDAAFLSLCSFLPPALSCGSDAAEVKHLHEDVNALRAQQDL